MSILNSFFVITAYIAVMGILLWWFYNKGYFQLDDRSLLQQKLFWLSIFAPIASFIYFGFFVWIGKSPNISVHGYSRFYEISKFPLLLLASSVPLASIINNVHRTIQTEKQIRESERKNLSDSYYTHLKTMVDFFQSIPSKEVELKNGDTVILLKTIKIEYPHHLYRTIYSLSNPNSGASLDYDSKFRENVVRAWAKITSEIKSLKDKPSRSTLENAEITYISVMESWYEIEISIINLCANIGIVKYHFGASYKISGFDTTLITNFYNPTDLYRTLLALNEITQALFDTTDMLTFSEKQLLSKAFVSTEKLLDTLNLSISPFDFGSKSIELTNPAFN